MGEPTFLRCGRQTNLRINRDEEVECGEIAPGNALSRGTELCAYLLAGEDQRAG